MVIVLLTHEALTPTGKPLAPLIPSLLIPVAPVVAMVIGGSAELIHNVGLDDGVPAVIFGVIAIVPDVGVLEQTGTPDALANTEYVPAIEALKLATLPGLDAPTGTVHA